MSEAIFSTDSHVVEPPDLWAERLPRELADRAPRLVSEESGDWWYVDGLRATSVSAGIDAGVRHEGAEKLRLAGRFQEVRKGAYIPAEKLADMDLDGVDKEIVYTTLGLRLWRLPDPRLLSAVHRAYNDRIAEFCGAKPDRLQGIALVLLDDVDEGIAELERAAKLGLVGAMISVYPEEERSYDRPIYDPFWAMAQDLGMPLSLHIGTNRALPPTSSATRDMSWSDIKLLSTPALYSTFPYWVQMSIANMVFAGVFERFPGLRVVSLEHVGGWAAFFMQTMDYTYTQRARRPQWPRFKTDAVPSDFFRRNVSLSIQEDALAVQLRGVIGIDSLVWGSDYPHHETTFPKSREVLEKLLEGLSTDERSKVLAGNANRLYGRG